MDYRSSDRGLYAKWCEVSKDKKRCVICGTDRRPIRIGLCMMHSGTKGQTKEIAKRIMDHKINFFGKCKEEGCNLPALSRVSGICYRHYHGYGESIAPKRRALSGCIVSFIYLLENIELNAQKIGVTNSPIQRLSYFMRHGFIPLELRVGDPNVISKIENEVLISIYRNGWNAGLHIGKELGGYTECWSSDNFRAKKISDIISVENTALVSFSTSDKK